MFRHMRLWLSLVYMSLFLGTGLRGQDLEAADQFARSFGRGVNTRKALDSLVAQIASRFPSPLERARAMFTWVATHVEYDCQNDGLPPLRAVTLEQVLTSGKSQCAGYANLLQYGMKGLGLDVVTIRGVAKTAKKDLWWTMGDLKPNHAWNAVNIDGRWRLLDATWASGASDADCKVVNHVFAPFYFDPAPEKFVLSHLPSDSQWQLMASTVKARTFLDGPVFQDPFYSHGIREVLPGTGVIEARKGDLIQFSFTSTTPLDSTAVWCEERTDIRPVFGRFTRKGDQYSFSYRVQSTGHYFLNVSLDGRTTALVYDLKVEL